MKIFNTKSNVEVFIIGDIIAYGREHVFPIEKLRLLSIYLYISIPDQQKIIQFHDENLNKFPYEQSLYNSSTIKNIIFFISTIFLQILKMKELFQK